MGAKAVALLNHPHDAPFGGLIGEQYQSNHAEPDKRGGPDGIRSCIKLEAGPKAGNQRGNGIDRRLYLRLIQFHYTKLILNLPRETISIHLWG